MMFRRKNRNAHTDHHRSSTRKSPLFDLSGMFVGFRSKKASDSDPAKSPTSPLDYKIFNLGNPFVRSPDIRSPRRSWECDRGTPGLTDALLDRSNSSGILLGNKIRINIQNPNIITEPAPLSSEIGGEDVSPHELGTSVSSLRGTNGDRMKSVELGKIRSCFVEFGRSSFPSREIVFNGSMSSEVLVMKSNIRDVAPGSLFGSLSASKIEESEDYTRITTHGPNPKTTHIFGDCILDCGPSELSCVKEEGTGSSSWFFVSSPIELEVPSLAQDFLSYCFFCKKKLEESDDIYMYRGEKAFCSCECREEVISAEESENTSPISSTKEENFQEHV